MQVPEIQLYELLKAKIGSSEAEAFVQLLEKKVDKKFEDAKNTLATKEDLAREMGSLETRLSRNIYIVGLIQYLAIIASIITLLRFFS